MSNAIRLIALVCVVASVVCRADDRLLNQQPYLGLSVRDTETGVVVGWIYPGPLGGSSFNSASGIARGDNLVAINNEPIGSADGFRSLIESLDPGSTITLTLRRSPDARSNASVPIGGEGGDAFTVEVELGSRDEWTGTVGRGGGGRSFPDSPGGAFEDRVRSLAREHGILAHETGLAKLLAHLRRVQDDALDPNSMPQVVRAFRGPLAVDTIADDLTNAIAPIRDDRSASTAERIETIDSFMATTLGFDRSQMMNATSGAELIDRCSASLVRTMRDNWSIDPDRARAQIATINTPPWAIDQSLFLMLNMHAHDAAARLESLHAESNGTPTDTASKGVDGKILAALTDEHGVQWIIGSSGPNTYNMSIVQRVLDVGGNDIYIWPEHDPGPEAPSRSEIIIDLAGNDRYESFADFAGPGTGIRAASILDDRQGNDTYIARGMFSIGAGFFGVGVIIDRAGDDTYDNTGPGSGWSQGVGFYGVGLVIDQAGRDTYRAEKLSQGVGGPRGFGAILDTSGNDLYQANGPNFPSAYGTSGVYLGMSQGFGFGVRGYAAGGIGLIDDGSGNDQYIAGEFSQGGGYFFGLGMIRDHAGNDLYHGNRYGQAFAAHQAVGILVDDRGDDTYWSMTAASQSGVWDESITLLLDRAGNDSYRCDGLGIGAAAMQALALFIDQGGNDRYSANPGSTIGESGRDEYHFGTSGVHSFSLFMDQGAGQDAYPPHRSNDTRTTTGRENPEDPAQATVHGLFVDE